MKETTAIKEWRIICPCCGHNMKANDKDLNGGVSQCSSCYSDFKTNAVKK